MARKSDGGTAYGDDLTYAQAASILGAHVSNIAQLIAAGHVTSRGGSTDLPRAPKSRPASYPAWNAVRTVKLARAMAPGVAKRGG